MRSRGGDPSLKEWLQLDSLTGVDVSEKSLELARLQFQSQRVHFEHLDHLPQVPASFDLAFCNGVFRRIPLRAARGERRFRVFRL